MTSVWLILYKCEVASQFWQWKANLLPLAIQSCSCSIAELWHTLELYPENRIFSVSLECNAYSFQIGFLMTWYISGWADHPGNNHLKLTCRKAQFSLCLFLPYSYQGPQWRPRIFAHTVPSAWDMPSSVLKGHRNPLQQQFNALLPNPKRELLSFILFIFKILFFSLRILYGVFDYFHLSSSSFSVCHPFPTHIVLCLCFPVLLCTRFRHLLIFLLAFLRCDSSSDHDGFLFWDRIPAFLVSHTLHEN